MTAEREPVAGGLRVGIVADVLTRAVSGPSRYLTALLRTMRDLEDGRDDHYVAISMRPVEEKYRALFDERHVLAEDGANGRVGRFVNHVWRYPGKVRGLPVDLLFSPTRKPPLYFWMTSLPRVLTIHGGVDYELPDRLHDPPSLRMRLTYRLFGHRPDAVVTVSSSSRREVEEHFGIRSDRIHVIPEGVDREVFYPPDGDEDAEAIRDEMGVGGPYLLHVSNYQPKKNGEGIVEAWRRVREATGEDLWLVMAGGVYSGLEAVQKTVDRAGLRDRYVHVGRVSDDRLRCLYGGAEVFVFPSFHEGFGLPVLEAMACGTPVVTSNVYGCAEVAGEAALKVDPTDPEAIAEAAQRVLEEPEMRNRLLKRGRDQVDAFDWTTTARRHGKLYRSLSDEDTE